METVIVPDDNDNNEGHDNERDNNSFTDSMTKSWIMIMSNINLNDSETKQ
ncbi:hypothetical protein LOAG_17626 [Loa loa]|uniref:Uncharacterized protein n=1 Tax=Loa loa TaxID=7209 RepID=A0A1S0UHZ3_LOALO|nr:hypothetical protein LOAG_17626 [Loa loa]EJD75185.1 hypothetical protein LOAG_17626 [Loa loa]